jgi:hypothetical protein
MAFKPGSNRTAQMAAIVTKVFSFLFDLFFCCCRLHIYKPGWDWGCGEESGNALYLGL